MCEKVSCKVQIIANVGMMTFLSVRNVSALLWNRGMCAVEEANCRRYLSFAKLLPISRKFSSSLVRGFCPKVSVKIVKIGC